MNVKTQTFNPFTPPAFLSARAKEIFGQLATSITDTGPVEDLALAYGIVAATANAIDRAEVLHRQCQNRPANAVLPQALAETLDTARKGLTALDLTYPLPTLPSTTPGQPGPNRFRPPAMTWSFKR